MITVDQLRRDFGAAREVEGQGFCYIVPADKFDPDWEVYLADIGFKCIFTDLKGGAKVVLVKRSAAPGKSVLLDAGKKKSEKVDAVPPPPVLAAKPSKESQRLEVPTVKPAAAGYALKDWEHAPVCLEKLSDLQLVPRLYPRQKLDKERVKIYALAMQSGSKFPTLKVALFRGQKWLVDGFHRFNAKIEIKEGFADCSELPFSSEAEIFAEAVRLNADHGKGFTAGELKQNIKRLKVFKFNFADIQSLVHVPVADIRRDFKLPISSVTGPNGKKTALSPEAAAAVELKQLKDALVLCRRFAESGKIPLRDAGVKELVAQARQALGRVKFDV